MHVLFEKYSWLEGNKGLVRLSDLLIAKGGQMSFNIYLINFCYYDLVVEDVWVFEKARWFISEGFTLGTS